MSFRVKHNLAGYNSQGQTKQMFSIDQARELVKGMSKEDIARTLNTPLGYGVDNMSTEQILEKAAHTTALLSSAGGLTPAQVKLFSSFSFDLTRASEIGVRTFNFRNDQLYIEKIIAPGRVMVRHTEVTDPGVRQNATFGRVAIQPVTFMLPLDISDDFLLENLEGQTAEATIIKIMSNRGRNDMEELYLTGESLGVARFESDFVVGGSVSQAKVDAFLSSFDGWFTRALKYGNIYDHENGTNFFAALVNIWKKMPNKFKKMTELGGLVWLMSPNLWANFNYQVSKIGGDDLKSGAIKGVLQQLAPLMVPAYDMPLLDDSPLFTEHVVLTGSVAMPLNFAPVDADTIVVTDSTLSSTLATPYILGTDYAIDEAEGTIVRVGSGITSGATVKVTGRCAGQVMLAHRKNMCLGIGYDMKAEKDRNIHKQVDEWALSIKVAAAVEEDTALSVGINFQDELVD